MSDRRAVKGAIICVILVLLGSLLWLPLYGGELEARQTVEKYVALSIKEDFNGIARELHVDLQEIEKMRAISRKKGPLQSARIHEVFVQILGFPWGVDLITIRGGKQYMERLGGSRRRLTGVFELDPK